MPEARAHGRHAGVSHFVASRFGLIAAVAAAVALGIAIASERWGGLVPCALCLLERWPYRIAIVLGLAAALLPPRPARVALGLAGADHAGRGGARRHPCRGGIPLVAEPVAGMRRARSRSGGSIAERLAHMPATPSKPCDDPTYLFPALKLSMAAMNLIFAGCSPWSPAGSRSGDQRHDRRHATPRTA